MDNMGENDSLIIKQYLSLNGQCLGETSTSSGESCNNVVHWWNESGSDTVSSASSYSDSEYDGSLLEWETEINAKGEVFFVESLCTSESDNSTSLTMVANSDSRESIPQHATRRSTKSKLAQLIKHRSSKRLRWQSAKISSSLPSTPREVAVIQEYSNSKVTFQDWQQGEIREVTIPVNGRMVHNLGRRATLSEMLLGLTTSKFGDGTRVMVAGFIPNGEAAKHCGIKIGDWLQSINGQEVSGQTLDAVLSAVKPPCEVTLILQRIAGYEVTIDEYQDNQRKGRRQSELVRRLTGVDPPPPLIGHPVAVLYMSVTNEMDSRPEDTDRSHALIYCFPAQSSPSQQDTFVAARGAFITLCHLFPNAGASTPTSSSVMVNDELVHILYSPHNDGLLLLAVPDSRCPLWEAHQLLADIIRNLEFCYKTVPRAFSDEANLQALDDFFALFFMRILTGDKWPAERASPMLQDENPCMISAKFEELLTVAHWLTVPHHIQVQIDNLLSHMEANDFGDMNEDFDHQQRLYTIIGSCYYHKGHLLTWHIEQCILVHIHTFLRQHCLLELNHREAVLSLLVWREVFLPITAPPGARHFLLCAGQGHDLLVVLLESGGCALTAMEKTGPDVCYVEMAQEVLHSIQKTGISSVASKWLSANCRPQITTPDVLLSNKASRKAENFLGFVKQLDSLTPTKASSVTGNSFVLSKKQPEVTSILKRRSSPDKCYGYMSSGVSLQGSTSEDSASQATSVMSEMSDESAPILGRRAERERITRHGSVDRFSESPSEQSEESESDWEEHVTEGSPYDPTSFGKPVALDMDDIIPSKLTTGDDNVLFHYVDLNICEGVLLSPSVFSEQMQSQKMQEILTNFKLSSQAIHKLLQNTVSFKKLMNQEINKAIINKALVAIKECGMLFEMNMQQSQSGRKSASTMTYWVVGRLFFTPHPREVYVCYQDCTSQNMVEIAFRLALSAAG
ncbi:protein inturned isoform X1 [Schistocerca americana]|uniref:protein inturned isoform X1 n=1 Tax=Schistocerca americana TaxID=7009 RepID=UPI001F4F3B74|nr:protein inturned isoform X1 [Schistocerca americana]